MWCQNRGPLRSLEWVPLACMVLAVGAGSKKGEPHFVLVAGNIEVIGRSEMYSSKSAMEKGIKSVMNNGPTKDVRDLT